MNTNETIELEIFNEKTASYGTDRKIIYAEEAYEILGCCMNVHNELGRGFSEIIYKDALEVEFRSKKIYFQREVKYTVEYKGILLPHFYYADFIVGEKIILEVKAQQGIVDEQYKQVLNYLAVSRCKLGLLVNFGEDSLKFKRLVL